MARKNAGRGHKKTNHDAQDSENEVTNGSHSPKARSRGRGSGRSSSSTRRIIAALLFGLFMFIAVRFLIRELSTVACLRVKPFMMSRIVKHDHPIA